LGHGFTESALPGKPQRKIKIIGSFPFPRRQFLAMAAAGRIFGPEWQRYSDPATEFAVIRLTDPGFTSGFTAPGLRQFTRRGELLHWSDRTGSRQAFLMHLRTGESRQITEAAALDPRSLCLTPDDRGLLFLDGETLQYGSLTSAHVREIYRLPSGASFAALSAAGNEAVFVAERVGGKSRIVAAGRGPSRTIREFPAEIDLMMARPHRSQLLYRAGTRFSLMGFDGSGNRDLRIAAGQTGEALWIPSGHTVIYLHIPDTARELITLRENAPDDNSDKLIAKTSQFASVSSNLNASVFVGASRSKASPYVLLLVRAVRRELALCEHHASDAAMVSPMFSPDSQSVFFVSDRHGKPALYRVHVERFVEQTEEGQ
jgi:oligogalacturonide lyase